MAQAGPQYSETLGQKEIGGLIEKGTKTLTKNIAKGRKARDQFITGKYRQLRKGAKDYVGAKKIQDLKENIQATTQEFIKTEGEKEFLSQKTVVPKGINTTEQGNAKPKTILDSGAKLATGNLVAQKTGTRRVTATSRELPTVGANMSVAQASRFRNVQQGTPRRASSAPASTAPKPKTRRASSAPKQGNK